MKKRYKIPLILLTATALAAGAIYSFAPWKNIAAQRLRTTLEAKGFENVRLSVNHAGLTGAELHDITIGGDEPLTLRNLTVKYHWRELMDGNLRDLAVDDLALTLRQNDNGWTLQGFRKNPDAAPFTLPVTGNEVHALLPFDTVALKNAKLNIITPSWNAAAPVNLSWVRDGHALRLDARDINYAQGSVTATIGTADAAAQLSAANSGWSGTWAAGDINVKTAIPLPPFTGAGTLTAAADNIKINGQLTGADDKTALSFSAALPFAAYTPREILITNATMPFNNGTVGARNVTIPLGDKQPIRFDADVDKVAVGDIIKTLFAGRAAADATVSGHVPVLYNPAGTGIAFTSAAMISPAWDAPATADHKLSVAAKNITYKQDNIDAAIASLTASAKPGKTGTPWTGTWSTGAVTLADNKMIPPLTGRGTFTVHPDHIRIDGQFTDTDGKTGARFTTAQYFTATAKNRLTITEAAMPWKNGTLRTRNVPVPLGKKATIRFDLIVDNVSLDELLQAMTGKRVSATGAVTGTLPLVYNPDGSIEPGKGALDTIAPGTITMPPDAIPGDNAQIALTRDILSNFHYENITITTETDESGNPVILLSLLGNNPDVQAGRAVKLNVRLSGDVLDFIRNNVILLTTPEKLIQQDKQ